MLIGYHLDTIILKKHSFYVNFKDKITVNLDENDFVKTEDRK